MTDAEPGGPVRLTGGCQCGAVRYEARMAPRKVHYCHCRMCQKAFGNAFAMLVPLRRDRLRWLTREPKWFASSSAAERGFCEACGTPLAFRYLTSEWTAVSLGSLDDPGAVPPEIHFGVESQLPWLHIADELPRERTDEDPSGTVYLDGMINHQHPDTPD